MSRSTIAVVDTKRLAAIFGPRDCHLRRIREALGVGIAARDDSIHIEGDEQAVLQATEVFEELDRIARERGGVEADEVARLLKIATGEEFAPRTEPIEVHRPGGQLLPRSAGQAAYVEAIRENDIVLCAGPAGSGKTFLAVAMAVSSLRAEQVKKIVLVRPAVEAGESLGYLPGDFTEKVGPYLRPLYDALHDLLPQDRVQKLLENETIEVAPLAYMRGRTLNRSVVILDEAQNTTLPQMKMFLTRLGNESKAIVTGDDTQIDLARPAESGLTKIEYVLRGIEGIEFVRFGDEDVVRHHLVQDIIRAFDEYDGRPGRPGRERGKPRPPAGGEKK